MNVRRKLTVDGLDKAVGINILVGAGGHSVGVAGL